MNHGIVHQPEGIYRFHSASMVYIFVGPFCHFGVVNLGTYSIHGASGKSHLKYAGVDKLGLSSSGNNPHMLLHVYIYISTHAMFTYITGPLSANYRKMNKLELFTATMNHNMYQHICIYLHCVYIHVYVYVYLYLYAASPPWNGWPVILGPLRRFIFLSLSDIKLAEEDQGGFKARSHLRGETNQLIKHPMLHPMLYLQALAVPPSEMFVGL